MDGALVESAMCPSFHWTRTLVAEWSFLLWGVLKFSDRKTYTNVAEKGQEKNLVPKIFSEAKKNVLLYACTCTWRIESKSERRLLEYYRAQFSAVNGTLVPTPRKKSAVKSTPSNVKESLVLETIDGVKSHTSHFYPSSTSCVSLIKELMKSNSPLTK